jgi:quercetin dioxygenase-like cupin family protein
MSEYHVAHLNEIPETTDGRVPWRTVRHHFGLTSFGANAFVGAAAGDRVINEHDENEDGQEELYVVISGHARFELDGESVDAPTGTFVAAAPGVKRTAFAEEAGTTILVVGGTPGKAYEPSGWELWAPFHPLYTAGDYEKVIELGRAAIEADTTYAAPLYNLACCESLAGHKREAVEHLRRAVERMPSLGELAKEDSDLDAIRDDAAVQELLAESDVETPAEAAQPT